MCRHGCRAKVEWKGTHLCQPDKTQSKCPRRETHSHSCQPNLSTCSRSKSLLDANSGFWQVPLVPESRPLTTFLTPFGRYCFNRLPFGITSAPEYFQRHMSKVLEGLEGVVCLIDDILVYGKDEEEHDARLRAVLRRLEEGLTLNRDKCSFRTNRVKFLGHVIDGSGISLDPEKISAICKLRRPGNVSELCRFLEMANQLSKFAPNLAETTKPLRDLLNKKSQWV